jgi:Ca-activated chloride channel family protein
MVEDKAGATDTPGKVPRVEDRGMGSEEWLTVGLRYKRPDAGGEASSKLIEVPFKRGRERRWEEASDDFRFAAAVAAFGMVLRESAYAERADFSDVLTWLEGTMGESTARAELEDLVKRARRLRSGRD